MTHSISETIQHIRKEKIPFELGHSVTKLPELKEYYAFYGIDWSDVKHSFGYLPVREYQVACHVFCVDEPKGTIIYCHGYSDHICSAKHLIRFFLDSGYNVAAFDQIGHGLSDGQPGCINHFWEYEQALEAFVTFCQDSDLEEPYYLVGHSLGGAVAQEYFFRHRTLNTFKHCILLAPLVRLEGYFYIQLKYKLAKHWRKSIPRTFRDNTCDHNFLEFVKENDPLQLREIPIDWMKAYTDWYQHARYVGPCEQPLLVIVGDQDETVDWQYTVRFFERKFPSADIAIIKNAAHHMPAEGEPYRSQIFGYIKEVLD